MATSRAYVLFIAVLVLGPHFLVNACLFDTSALTARATSLQRRIATETFLSRRARRKAKLPCQCCPKCSTEDYEECDCCQHCPRPPKDEDEDEDD